MAYELTAEQMKIADNTYRYHRGDSRQSRHAACAAVLESATEPGAPLSEAEWERLCELLAWEAIGPEHTIFFRRNINSILAKRCVLKDAVQREPALWHLWVADIKRGICGAENGNTTSEIASATCSACLRWAAKNERDQREEMIKRLRGATVVAGFADWNNWDQAIDQFVKAVQAQGHLSKLASDRYERLLELERQLADRQLAPAQAQGDEETARAMIDAYVGPGRTYTPADEKRMLAVLQVVREGYWSAEAIEELIAQTLEPIKNPTMRDSICFFLDTFRARLSAPAAKTPEERAIFFQAGTGLWCVVVDKNRDHPLSAYDMKEKVARMYHRAVIAELAQLRKDGAR